jgi:hypothetical protein
MQLALAAVGCRLFRNNVGLFKTEDGRKIRTGLCVGSSDLVGWKKIIVTQSMVGKPIAIFIACEVKKEGNKPSPEQRQFLEVVKDHGGFALWATSEKEALDKLDILEAEVHE